MHDNLIVVFSNYNGYRTCNDLIEPRIQTTINSFQKTVSYWNDLNVLLLDNNSKDGSEKILCSYASNKWQFEQKKTEDYYLGTMYKLLSKYKGLYEYMMLVDNDHFFFQNNFLETSMNLLANHKEIVCLQQNEVTLYDLIDHYKKPIGIAGIFDKIGNINGNLWLRSARFKGNEPFFTKLPREKGLGLVSIPNNTEKRICWLYFAASNCVINIEKFLTLFERKELRPPYYKNAERLALFASSVRELGHSAYLARGASINVGFRKFLKESVSVRDLISKYVAGSKSLHVTNGYSYFLKNKKYYPIENEISSYLLERNKC